jgi:hypothetical protein
MYAASGKMAKDIILFSNSVLKQELLYKPALHPVTPYLQNASKRFLRQKKSWNIFFN